MYFATGCLAFVLTRTQRSSENAVQLELAGSTRTGLWTFVAMTPGTQSGRRGEDCTLLRACWNPNVCEKVAHRRRPPRRRGGQTPSHRVQIMALNFARKKNAKKSDELTRDRMVEIYTTMLAGSTGCRNVVEILSCAQPQV